MNKSDRLQLSIILANLKRAKDWMDVDKVAKSLEALLLEGH
jgi:hypothetical protein